MAAPSGSFFGIEKTRHEEILSQSIDTMLADVDSFWKDTFLSSQGVVSTSDIGRDHKIVKLYNSALAGRIESGGFGSRADFPLYGDPSSNAIGAKMFDQDITQTWPDPRHAPNPRTFRLGVPMRSMLGTLLVTLAEMQAEITPSFIDDVIAQKVEGYARNWARTICNYLYLSQNNYYRISTATNSALQTNEGTISFQPDNEASHRYEPGMLLDAVNTATNTPFGSTAAGSSGLAATGDYLVVDRVDHLTNTVWLRAFDASAGTWTDGSASNDFGDVVTNVGSTASNFDGAALVLYNTKGTSTTPYSASPYYTGIAGFNSWIKYDSNDPYLLGDERDQSTTPTSHSISITEHPEFRSFYHDLSSNPLTEHTLRKILRRFHAAKQPYGRTVDTGVASDGVWLAYEATKIGRETLDRTGRLSSLADEGSANEVRFHLDGRSYKMHISNWIEDGTVYFTKTSGQNWKRLVPPKLGKTRSQSGIEPGIPYENVGPAMTGTDSLYLPMTLTSSGDAGGLALPTEGLQMPGWLRMNLVPDQPDGIKLVNCATDKLYSD